MARSIPAVLGTDRRFTRSSAAHLLIVGAAFLAYAATYYGGFAAIGPIVGMAAVVPIVLAAHSFGTWGGLVVAILAGAASTGFLYLLGHDGGLFSVSRIAVLGFMVVFGLASGVIRDVNRRGRRSEELLRIAMDAAQDGLWDIDLETRRVFFSPRWFTMLGYEPDELPQAYETWIDLLHPDDREGAVRRIEHVARRARPSFNTTFRLRTKDGGWRWILARGKVVEVDEHGRGRRLIGIHSDVTELKEAESELMHLAYHDQLTGLLNRKSFYERAEEILGQAARSSAERLVAFLVIDLDNFKDVNDSFGHDLGDELLRQAATRLQRQIRKTDYLFRPGGDEFTIILTGLQQATDAALVASNLIRAFSDSFELGGHTVYVGLSIGMAVYPRDGHEAFELIRKSDTALYRSKRDRDTYRFYTMQMQSDAIRKMEVVNSLRRAIDRDELCVHYQPIVDAAGAIRGAEALVRWEDPERGLRMPGEFIDIAEETGLILRLGRWVLAQATVDAARWHRELGVDLRVSVNISPRQLRHRSMTDDIDLALAASDLPPDLLTLELTEGSFVDPDDPSAQRLREFQRRRITISLDDFGTGYSSMSYLKRLPVDTIKIDRSFVVELPHSEEDAAIVRAVTTMAHGLGLNVLAEGVDSSDQVEFLTELGCDYFQGYYFSKPVTLDRFEAMIPARVIAVS